MFFCKESKDLMKLLIDKYRQEFLQKGINLVLILLRPKNVDEIRDRVKRRLKIESWRKSVKESSDDHLVETYNNYYSEKCDFERPKWDYIVDNFDGHLDECISKVLNLT